MLVYVWEILQKNEYIEVTVMSKEEGLKTYRSKLPLLFDKNKRFANIEVDGKELKSLVYVDEKFDMATDRKVVPELHRFLCTQLRAIQDPDLFDICNWLLSDEGYQTWPSSLKYHGFYESVWGGLLVHTAAVMKIAVKLMEVETFRNINQDVVRAAVLWHDYGKVYDYEDLGDGFFGYNGVRSKIGHIVNSNTAFSIAAGRVNLDKGLSEEISHCILASHGRREWEAAVLPNTPEAHLLHYCDMMSVFCSNADLFFEAKNG